MHYAELFYSLSFPIQKNRLLNKAAFVWNKLLCFVLRHSYLPYCHRHPVVSGVSGNTGSPMLIVSMTSFPKRMATIEPTMESLIRQTMKPDRIFVWLSAEEYPERRVPPELKKYEAAGVEVCFSDLNLKPHKKSYHTAELYPDSFIITVDDDIIYDETLVEQLYRCWEKSPVKTVVCGMAHEIVLGLDGRPKGYDSWNWESIGIEGPSALLVAKGAGGVLYPPGFFADEYFDIDTIRETCLMADDLWLKFIGLLHGYTVRKTRAKAKTVYASSEESQKVSLMNQNNGEKRNNLYLSKLVERFDTIDWTHLQ